MQPALFHPKALEAIQGFPRSVKKALGEALLDLQHGRRLTMPLSRPMPVVGKGVHELRVKDQAGTYRAFYLVRDQHGIHVIHAFRKKAQKTPMHEIELGQRRLKELGL